MSVNQNVPTCVAVGHQQRLPAEPGLREQQPVLVGRRVELSRPARVVRAAPGARGAAIACRYTLSKSMNNVGEFFFSSPIDPFDLSKDWGRSDDDQRHRLVINGTHPDVDGAGQRRCGSGSRTGSS